MDYKKQEPDKSRGSVMNDDYGSGGDMTLESILAEYKSDAFVAGDKKTPADLLQQRTDSILREVLEDVRSERQPAEKRSAEGRAPVKKRAEESLEAYPVPPSRPRERVEPASERVEQAREPARPERTSRRAVSDVEDNEPVKVWSPKTKTPVRPAKRRAVEPEPEPEPESEEPKRPARRRGKVYTDEAADNDGRYFEDLSFADKNVRPIPPDDEDEEDEEDEKERKPGLLSRIFLRHDEVDDEEDEEDGEDENDDEEDGDEEKSRRRTESEYTIPSNEYDDETESPNVPGTVAHLAARVPSLRMRAVAVLVLSLFMLLFTFLYSRGIKSPFGIGDDPRRVTGALLIMELAVIGIGIDVLIKGAESFATLDFCAETLVLVSCFASVLDGLVMLGTNNFERGLCLSVVSAFSVLFALQSKKAYCIAMVDSLKTSVAAQSPFGVFSEDKSIEDRLVLKKVTGATRGFYNRITEADFGERLYERFAPLFVILSLVLAALASFARKQAGSFFHILSIMTAISASFPAASVFTLPFRYAAGRTKKAGGAIAGWGGASEIYYSDGAIISDQDLFPVGNVSLSGLKLFGSVSQRKVIVYTSSLVIASGSGLVRIFEELLRTQGFSAMTVKEFENYDGGGIGAVISGERIMIGTGAFMNLRGIRIPDEANVKSNLFAAINGELAGAFSISYVPTSSVQSALVALLNTRTRILMAIRDFNVTPNMIHQRFKVSTEGVEYMPIDTVYKLSDSAVPEGCGACAVLCRGGLAPFAEVITRGRLLKLITEFATFLALISSGIGLVMMFFLCWAGAFMSASAINIFLFMGVIYLVFWVMCQFVRR